MTAVHPNVEVGGLIMLMEEPARNRRTTHAIPDHKHTEFIEALEQIRDVRLKELHGPLINGLWVATFEFTDGEIMPASIRMRCYKIFVRFLEPVEGQVK